MSQDSHLTPNSAHIIVFFPPLNENETYSFFDFIQFFNAFCVLKQWSTCSDKVKNLSSYLHGTPKLIYNLVKQHFSLPQDVDRKITFSIIVEHISALLHVNPTKWDDVLERCKCSYCQNRVSNRTLRCFAHEPYFAALLGLDPASQGE